MPQRIVSLVPSLTELVFWLGAGNRVVGRTNFCTEPRGSVEHIPTIGGTKTPNVELVLASSPDLVIANHEENRREDVEALRSAGLEVLVTDPASVREASSMVTSLGDILDVRERAAELVSETDREISMSRANPVVRVFVAVWKQPLMGLGGDSYGNDIIRIAGGDNVTADLDRYPKLTLEEVAARRPSLVLLPDEPYRFRESDRPTFEVIAPARLIDGKLLWWYGPRMPGAIRQLRELFQEASAR